VKDLARKGTKLYQELRKDITLYLADRRRKRKEDVDGKMKEDKAVREYKQAVRELEQVAIKVAASDNGNEYEMLSVTAKRAYMTGNKVTRSGLGLLRFDPNLEMFLLDAFDHARSQWPVIGLVCRSRGYAAGISPGSSFVER
jgi:hypothetical protein